MLELPPTETLPSAVDSYERGIALCGMSKSMGMAGIRLGWLATTDKALFARFQLLHDYYSICHAAPCEVKSNPMTLKLSLLLQPSNMRRSKPSQPRLCGINSTFNIGLMVATPRMRTREDPYSRFGRAF